MSQSATTTPLAMETSQNKSSGMPFLIAGIIGLVIAGIGLVMGISSHEPRFFLSWLLGFSFWFAIIIGMLFMIMIWYLFGAKWPIIIRRQLEHCLAALPYLLVIFLVLVACALIEPGIIWKWMDGSHALAGGGTVAEDVLYQKKAVYLNSGFFIVRVFAFFGFWILLASILRSCSFKMDVDPQEKYLSRCVKWSAAGVFFTAITLTLAAIDWFKSLEYHWFSTMYGVWYFSAAFRAAIAATIILCFFLAKNSLKGIYNKAHQYDLSCMLLAFTVFWAYISFCQYFLIYNANIPEETFWYNIRELALDGKTKSSWWYVSLALIFGNFFAPFFALLVWKTKVTKAVVFVSFWILAFTILDLYFNIMPAKLPVDNEYGYYIRQFIVFDIATVFDIAAIVGVGGICIFAFLRSAAKQKVIPIHDPRIEGSLHRHL